ncbi:type II secretion system F family protein [Magnetospirillum sp. SS-4]|uniref:type II secretion system F family protein n=1 Tax=Magnetospirillum sp. SS-4 TaxID=2681465 RepID=UPI001384B77D|nr:type II secretion system F family protein [Magnetospirillum sp. SS-4]CAA7616847.1 Flp pilus assembly protein TadB [Magnetospirillum sp. SS-4]
MLELLARLPAEIAAIVTVLLAALGVLGWSMYTLIHGSRARIRRRLAAIAGGASHPRRQARLPKRKSVQARLKQAEGTRTRRRGYRLREQLMQAGLHVEVWHYLAACAVLALLTFGVALLMALTPPWALVAAVVAGVGLPKLTVALMARRRVGRFTAQFADAIDVVVRGIRSGLPLGECINIIGREMPDPIGTEFRLITEGQKLGLNLQEVLARAVDRMPIPELRYFSIVIAIQQQTGGNLADTLVKLTDVLRARKRMREKVQAFASEARASAYIIGSLPIIVILALAVLSPQYIGILFTTETGHVLLFAGAVTEIVGLLVMRKMINFDM